MFLSKSILIFLMVAFCVKHFLCDFQYQTARMLEEKGTYGAVGGIQHASVHAAGTAIILYYFTSGLLWVSLVMFDFLAHYHIDWAKMRLSRGLTPANRNYWLWFGADQLLHYLCYVVIIACLMHN